MKKNCGFTLVEILVTIVILVVLAGLAMPSYSNSVEQSRANEGRTVINVIHMGEKIFRMNNAAFWDGGANATMVNINNNLNVDIAPVYYDDIDFSAVNANGYTVRVTRNAVQGTAGSRCFQYVWNDVTDTLTQGGGGCIT